MFQVKLKNIKYELEENDIHQNPETCLESFYVNQELIKKELEENDSSKDGDKCFESFYVKQEEIDKEIEANDPLEDAETCSYIKQEDLNENIEEIDLLQDVEIYDEFEIQCKKESEDPKSSQKYTRKTTRHLGITPSRMLNAITEVKKNKRSIRSVAKEFKINYRTLTRYCQKIDIDNLDLNNIFKRSQPKITLGYKKSRQIFTEELEKKLESYLSQAYDIYYGLSSKEVKKLAYGLAKSKKLKVPKNWERNKQAGIDWYTSFMKRHKNISLKSPERTKLEGDDTFFENFQNVIKKYNIQAYNTWNMDEICITTIQKPNRIIARRGYKLEEPMSLEDKRSLVTLAVAVSGSGDTLPPFFVFPRTDFNVDFIRNGPSGCRGGSDPSGWITEDLFVQFLEHFRDHVNFSKENPCLLLIDNHESYLSIEGLDFAKENGIVVLSFPPYCTHRLQPLHSSVFGLLKKYVNTEIDQRVFSNSCSMTIYDIPGVVKKVLPMAFTRKNIQQGFRSCGVSFFTPTLVEKNIKVFKNGIGGRFESPKPGPSGGQQNLSFVNSPLSKKINIAGKRKFTQKKIEKVS